MIEIICVVFVVAAATAIVVVVLGSKYVVKI